MRASTYWNHTGARCFGSPASNTLTPESHVIRSVTSGCRSMTSKSSSRSSSRHSRRQLRSVPVERSPPPTSSIGPSVDPVTHWRPTYSFQRSVANVPRCRSRPTGRNGTVQTSERAPRTPPLDPLLFSIVNIESTALLFSLWNIEFVLLVLLDHAPPPHSGGHDWRDLQRFSISIFPNMSPG